MSFHRSIRNRRHCRHRLRDGFELQLTSLMDALVIILIFLLKSYSASTSNFSAMPGIQLPLSRAQEIPSDSLQVIVTANGITFENELIVPFPVVQGWLIARLRPEDLDEGGLRILPLYASLMKARGRSELLRTKSQARDQQGNPLPFESMLAIQADKTVHYDLLRKVMYTSAAAGYRVFRFLTLREES